MAQEVTGLDLINRKWFNNIVHLLGFFLMVMAYRDLWKRPKTRGPKWLWGILIFLVNYLGPIFYLVWGRHAPTPKTASRAN
ncbi:PLDc_N domain-containing protein [Exiguobacterium sp. RIT594]|nr:PLDc_N domain-containing protein [Exiguobacterium sp. RIT594]